MCGRFTQYTPKQGIAKVFDFDDLFDLTPRYNIAPTEQVTPTDSAPHSIVRLDSSRRQA